MQKNYLIDMEDAVVVKDDKGKIKLHQSINLTGLGAVSDDRCVFGGAGTAVSASAGIGDNFVREVVRLMKPGTSALFVLDSEGDMDVILHSIRGLGGTVLKTNVDLGRAQLIRSTLATPRSGSG
jgi:uncharacterized membrane protein